MQELKQAMILTNQSYPDTRDVKAFAARLRVISSPRCSVSVHRLALLAKAEGSDGGQDEQQGSKASEDGGL
jgi:hypothetical protein